jgi:hypothetical protein
MTQRGELIGGFEDPLTVFGRPVLVGHRLCVAADNCQFVPQIVARHSVQHGREVGLIAESLLLPITLKLMTKESSREFGKEKLPIRKRRKPTNTPSTGSTQMTVRGRLTLHRNDLEVGQPPAGAAPAVGV